MLCCSPHGTLGGRNNHNWEDLIWEYDHPSFLGANGRLHSGQTGQHTAGPRKIWRWEIKSQALIPKTGSYCRSYRPPLHLFWACSHTVWIHTNRCITTARHGWETRAHLCSFTLSLTYFIGHGVSVVALTVLYHCSYFCKARTHLGTTGCW